MNELKNPLNRKIKILVVPSDRTGVGAYRSTNPHITLESQYPDDFHVDIDYEPKIDDDNWLKQYDIIHYHRTFGSYENMESVTKKLKDLGIVTFMDIDDYWAPGSHHPAYILIKNAGLDKKIVNNLLLAENVITTTDIFADEIRKINKKVFVIPNAINPQEKQFIPAPTTSNRVRIGWLGGSSHLEDLNLLNGVVNGLKSSGLINKAQFVLCGFDLRGTITQINEKTGEKTQRPIQPKESVWYKYEQIFTDNYSIVSPEYKAHLLKFTNTEFENIDNEPYRRVWTKNINSYATNYNLFDVSLAPLKENIFNKVKSQLKVIESGFFKKALIAQNYGPYALDLKAANKKDGVFDETGNALLVDTLKNHKQWSKHIKFIIENPDKIKLLGENLYNTVKDTYSAEAVSEKRRELYINALLKKKELNNQLVTTE